MQIGTFLPLKYQAGNTCFTLYSPVRPVIMTAVTTGLGLAPLLFATGTGSEVQRPLAAVVIGGLVTATILTLVILPALYPWFADRSNGDNSTS
ncbi:hypothetical protein GCM10011403_27710 [Pseudohongiella nitratireducens]|uniref:Cobalt-zinc-cadmium resistance protein CzcA n=1 Tax=Pseudohongiella nitratireducens TaxID=1768907 RepID=A0A916QNT2_9GAMM|nr:hypothetical protein GCM10011403_27710 [Pseudohongiella nitratireducens]